MTAAERRLAQDVRGLIADAIAENGDNEGESLHAADCSHHHSRLCDCALRPLLRAEALITRLANSGVLDEPEPVPKPPTMEDFGYETATSK